MRPARPAEQHCGVCARDSDEMLNVHYMYIYGRHAYSAVTLDAHAIRSAAARSSVSITMSFSMYSADDVRR